MTDSLRKISAQFHVNSSFFRVFMWLPFFFVARNAIWIRFWTVIRRRNQISVCSYFFWCVFCLCFSVWYYSRTEIALDVFIDVIMRLFFVHRFVFFFFVFQLLVNEFSWALGFTKLLFECFFSLQLALKLLTNGIWSHKLQFFVLCRTDLRNLEMGFNKVYRSLQEIFPQVILAFVILDMLLIVIHACPDMQECSFELCSILRSPKFPFMHI